MWVQDGVWGDNTMLASSSGMSGSMVPSQILTLDDIVTTSIKNPEFPCSQIKEIHALSSKEENYNAIMRTYITRNTLYTKHGSKLASIWKTVDAYKRKGNLEYTCNLNKTNIKT